MSWRTTKRRRTLYNADNQLSADSFDGNGNPTTYVTSAGSQTLTFDSDNELTGYGSALTAEYGADGLRAWKNNGSATTYFLYDGDKPVCELNSSGTVTAVNTFGPDGLISRTTSAGTTYYTFDANGSTAQRTDSTGSVLSTDEYDAFGDGLSVSHLHTPSRLRKAVLRVGSKGNNKMPADRLSAVNAPRGAISLHVTAAAFRCTQTGHLTELGTAIP